MCRHADHRYQQSCAGGDAQSDQLRHLDLRRRTCEFHLQFLLWWVIDCASYRPTDLQTPYGDTTSRPSHPSSSLGHMEHPPQAGGGQVTSSLGWVSQAARSGSWNLRDPVEPFGTGRRSIGQRARLAHGDNGGSHRQPGGRQRFPTPQLVAPAWGTFPRDLGA